MFPLLVSGESSSTSAKARAENLSCGRGGRWATRSVRSGVITRQEAHAEVLNRRSSRVLVAEAVRR